jgi:hypothetical protein
MLPLPVRGVSEERERIPMRRTAVFFLPLDPSPGRPGDPCSFVGLGDLSAEERDTRIRTCKLRRAVGRVCFALANLNLVLLLLLIFQEWNQESRITDPVQPWPLEEDA